MKTKRVLVHIGPHKTGSSAIQKWLHENGSFLSQHSLRFLQSKETHLAAKLLANENYVEASELLSAISVQISSFHEEQILLSQEDFAGQLPGRSKKKGIYPRLLKNLRVIRRNLAPHDVAFIFFQREDQDWLQSCYRQNLVYRTQFSNFETFLAQISSPPNWAEFLQYAQTTVKSVVHRLSYSRSPERGIQALLEVAGVTDVTLPSVPDFVNQSPSDRNVRLLEHINSVSAFPRTAWFAKKLVLDGSYRERLDLTSADQGGNSVKFQELARRQAMVAFPELIGRVDKRFSRQDVEDLLPDEASDLTPLLSAFIPSDAILPTASRQDMAVQSKILDYHFRGKTALSKLNALVISYLRRNTQFTTKAQILFLRIWSEFGILLVNELTSRWLISTLQTFFDHGANEHQRIIGASGYFYANLIKIYEGERSIDGLPQDGTLSNTQPTTPNRFRGLDRYSIGGTDLLLNTNALALEVSMRDPVAGLVLQEFALRVKASGNVFTRSDATRIAYGIEVDEFKDAWSFYSRPDLAS